VVMTTLATGSWSETRHCLVECASIRSHSVSDLCSQLVQAAPSLSRELFQDVVVVLATPLHEVGKTQVLVVDVLQQL
jgi:hypothetical protein